MINPTAPRIGLTAYREQVSWGAWDERADLLSAGYADSVVAAGAVALILPAIASAPAAAVEAVLDGVHGLVLAGGPDVDPGRYGQGRQAGTDEPRTDRDEWEVALLRAAMGRDMPVLAICRGLQILNVALGGTLHQHLPDVLGSDVHRPVVGDYVHHRVVTEAGSHIGRIIGPEADVPGHHHQGLDALAVGLRATAWADDAVVEAAERPGSEWVVGVQWHPEVGTDPSLFEAFVKAASAYRDRDQESSRPADRVNTPAPR